jgi:hypothetical protein
MFENDSKKYESLIQEEIKRRLDSGSALLPFDPEPSVFSSAV